MRRLALLLVAAAAHAAVTNVVLKERTPVPGFAAYEHVTATVHFAVNPTLPANTIVRDLAFAPRNAQGLVEFSADLEILRPRDPSQGNGTVLLEVPNRGNKTIYGSLFLKDHWLLEAGFVVAWVGWQGDVAPSLLHAELPAALGVRGLARHEFIGPKPAPLPFPAADPDSTGNVLTVRDSAAAPRTAVARQEWQFADSGRAITLNGGFQPNLIYDLVYLAKDPPVTGLGLAAVRDTAVYFKGKGAKRVIGYGLSQSGRFLRQFLYDGFNSGEQGGRAFDGMIVDAAGAGRGSFNHRFAIPGKQGNSVNEHFWPVDIFPFTDQPEPDPGTGRTDGLLMRADAQHVTPRLMLINSSVEYWARGASLITTGIDGRDVPPGPSTRVYFIAGTTHGSGGAFPPTSTGFRYPPNFVTKAPAVRALLAAMQSWLADGLAPPPSVYPRRPELATPEQLQPRVPVKVPAIYRLNFDVQPPAVGDSYPLLVPRIDPDGIDIGGIRLPQIAVPLGAHTGWNFLEPRPGNLSPLAGLTGSFVPYPQGTLRERYGNRKAYLAKVRAAAAQLVASRYLLPRDVGYCVEQAAAEWDFVMARR